jgi:hypothetical protein
VRQAATVDVELGALTIQLGLGDVAALREALEAL